MMMGPTSGFVEVVVRHSLGSVEASCEEAWKRVGSQNSVDGVWNAAKHLACYAEFEQLYSVTTETDARLFGKLLS